MAKASKSKTVTVTSQYLAGKTVNVPHTEHAQDNGTDAPEKGTVTFGRDGKAEVSATLAESLKRFFPRFVS